MISGTHPTKRIPKRKFHRNFGSTDVRTIPDFNLDAGIWMPSQVDDNAPTECTGYTIADIITDVTKVIQSPDFAYASALFMEGLAPSTAGADFHSALEALIVLGSLPIERASITALSHGELYCSDWRNWDDLKKLIASKNVQNGVYNALGKGNSFDSILSCLYTGKVAVSVGTPWFPEWEPVGNGNGKLLSDGILPMPSLNVDFDTLPWHNWTLKGRKTIGQPMLIGKSWQGKKYGDGGFHYVNSEVLNAILDINGTGAITVAMDANRILSLLRIAFEHLNIISYMLGKKN